MGMARMHTDQMYSLAQVRVTSETQALTVEVVLLLNLWTKNLKSNRRSRLAGVIAVHTYIYTSSFFGTNHNMCI